MRGGRIAEASVGVAMGEINDSLLVDLRRQNSGLPRLVERLRSSRRSWVAVSAAAVAAWEQREPEAWATVHAWLASRQCVLRPPPE